ncbi:phage minor capsid protein [Staphylococcus arlettae]|uniref:phage minor capsid protein n=1 Tax=Staphylococcus arlettae TaxID=29378 RepID=UPI0021CE5E2E|nr:phage minor capsid protein [Staphylococcus arlettae]UXU48915.1 phage minor capsid protein [Staphylococcus arlettae]
MALTPEQVKKLSQFLKNQVKELVSGVNIESEKDTQRMYMAIEKLFDDLGSSVQKEVPKTIYEQYAKGLSNAQQQLIDTGLITSAGNFNVQNAIAQQFVHTDAIVSIVTDTMQDLASAFRTAKKYSKNNVDVAIKDVQDEVAKGLMVGMTNKQMSQRVAKKFGEQNMTSFVTVDGKHLPLDFYAETVVRTKTQTAYNHSHLNRYAEDDIKHVTVTGNIPTCGECVRYRGHVFATERGDQFPYINLYTTFPKHPNCQCNFRPYIIDFKSDDEVKRDLEHSKTFDENKDSRTQAEIERYNTDQKAKAKARRNSLSYNKMRNRLGSDGPQTFKEYLQVKTNNKAKYHEWVSQMKKVYDPNNVSGEQQSSQEAHTDTNNVSDTNNQDEDKQAQNEAQNNIQGNTLPPIETLDELIGITSQLSKGFDEKFKTNLSNAQEYGLRFEIKDIENEKGIEFNRLIQEVINEKFGYNDLPQSISKNEFDLIDDNKKLIRGLKDSDNTNAMHFIEQYKTGNHYVGKGFYGHGTYSAVMTEENKEMVFATYANEKEKNIMHMTISDDANVVTKKQMRRIKKEWRTDIKSNEEISQSQKDIILGVISNTSNIAIMLGYDAMYIGGQEYYVLLNRGKVSVVDE